MNFKKRFKEGKRFKWQYNVNFEKDLKGTRNLSDNIMWL